MMPQQARVFLPILSSRFNVSAAAAYGQVVYLLETEDRSPFQTDAVIREFLGKLEADRYDPAQDFVALTGPSIFCAILLAVVVTKYRTVKTLMFHASGSRYVERVIDSSSWEAVSHEP